MAEEEDDLYSLLERAKDLAVEVEDHGLAKELKAKLAYLKSPRTKQSASPNVEDMVLARINKPVDPPPTVRGSAPPVQTLRKNRRNNKISPETNATNATNALAVMASPNVEMRRNNTPALPTSQLWRKTMKPTTGTVFWINTYTGEVTDIDPTNPSQKQPPELQRQMTMRTVQAAAHMKQRMEHHYKEEESILEHSKSYVLVCGCCPCFCLLHCCCPKTFGTQEHIDRLDLHNCSKHDNNITMAQCCGRFLFFPCRVLGVL